MTRKLRYRVARAIDAIPDGPEAIPLIKDAIRDILYLVSEHYERISADHTIPDPQTVRHYIIRGSNSSAITITFPATPTDGDRIVTTREDAQITLSGNGKNIDGSTTAIISAVGATAECEFREDDDEWRIV